ncbi:hypothetical protein EDB84DRAFT_1658485 [Lactarius hengduanensis]|nr:hypothetical protein EDB84DRAFT_1658485 [Lactarius hengduanensis]
MHQPLLTTLSAIVEADSLSQNQEGSGGPGLVDHIRSTNPGAEALSIAHFKFCDIVVRLRSAGHKVVLVSSGAIGVGPQRMALATIGQGRLIELWDNLFGQLGQPIAQVLLTRGDISDVRLPRSLLLPCCLLPHLCTYPLTVTPEILSAPPSPSIESDFECLPSPVTPTTDDQPESTSVSVILSELESSPCALPLPPGNSPA